MADNNALLGFCCYALTVSLYHHARLHLLQINGVSAADQARDPIPVLELLLRHGCAIEARDVEGRTPLLVAAHKKQDTLVQALLEQKADPHAVDTKQQSALQLAGTAKSAQAVKVLSEFLSGGQLLSREMANSCISDAGVLDVDADALTAFLQRGGGISEINRRDAQGCTPLMLVTAAGAQQVRYMYSYEIDDSWLITAVTAGHHCMESPGTVLHSAAAAFTAIFLINAAFLRS